LTLKTKLLVVKYTIEGGVKSIVRNAYKSFLRKS